MASTHQHESGIGTGRFRIEARTEIPPGLHAELREPAIASYEPCTKSACLNDLVARSSRGYSREET